jgi:hypothetical protein
MGHSGVQVSSDDVKALKLHLFSNPEIGTELAFIYKQENFRLSRTWRIALSFVFYLAAVDQLAHAVSIPTLLTIPEILHDSKKAELFYSALKARFKNSDFNETLFRDNASAKSPRFSHEMYLNTLGTLRSFLERNPDELLKLNEFPPVAPFRISPNGYVEVLEETIQKSWSVIGSRLSQLTKEPTKTISSNEEQNKFLRTLLTTYMQTKDQEVLKSMADALIVFEVSHEFVAKLNSIPLPSFAQYLILEEIERNAIKRGRELRLPGKLLDSLLAHSSLGDIPRSNFFRKGTTILPMSRSDALFKGVGPGECVRAACNRYLDALFPDAFHMRILKDGKETGFIGIYKTIYPAKKIKGWFVETIQTPFLFDQASGGKVMRSLMKYLQQLALFDDSIITLPASTFNSYIHLDVLAELQSLPEATSRGKIKTEFQNENSIAKYKKFTSSDLSETDQMIARRSGYGKTVLTNGFTFNRGTVVPLGVFLDQPDWIVRKSYQILNGSETTAVQLDLKLDPIVRARLLRDLNSGYMVKKFYFELMKSFLQEGKTAEAELIEVEVYKKLPKKLRDASFEQQFEYVKDRVARVMQSASHAQALKDEVMLKASSWQDYQKIVQLEDIGSDHYVPFLLSTFDLFSSEASEDELLKLYGFALRHMHDDQFDLQLTRKIGGRLKSSRAFVELVKMMNGEGVQGAFADDNLRDLYIAENWDRFFPAEESWTARKKFAEEILDRVHNGADLQIRRGLFKFAKDLAEMAAYLSISKLLKGLDDEETLILSRLVTDSAKDKIENANPADLITRNYNPDLLSKWVFPSDLEDIRSAFLQVETEDQLHELLRSNHIHFRDVLKIVGSHHRESLQKQAADLVRQNFLDDSFFSFDGDKALSALASYKPAELEELVAQTRKMSFIDRLKVSAVTHGSNVLPLHEAAGLRRYIKVIQTLDTESQRQAFEKLMKHSRVIVGELLPEHRALLEDLHQWGTDLEKNAGLHFTHHKIKKVFSNSVMDGIVRTCKSIFQKIARLGRKP